MLKIEKDDGFKGHKMILTGMDSGLMEEKGEVWNGKRSIQNDLKEIDMGLDEDIKQDMEQEGFKVHFTLEEMRTMQ